MTTSRARSAAVVGTEVRLLAEDDAGCLADLLRKNWDFLAPFEPSREPEYFTADYQAESIRTLLADHAGGRTIPYAILHSRTLVGRITVSEVVRGAFQSGNLGYYVAEAVNGRGVATEAVAQVVEHCFGELGLHRLQAGTLLSNSASQAVLQRNGFERIGVARRYLKIAGRWQDHVLYQRTS